MSRRVLLLVSHQSYRAEAFMDAIGGLDLAVTVGTDREQALGFLNPAGNLTLDFAAPVAAAARAAAFARTWPIDAVLAAEDEGVILAAAIAAELGLPGHPVQAVVDARDKHRSRQAWRSAGLPTPAFARYPLDSDPEALAGQLAAAAHSGHAAMAPDRAAEADAADAADAGSAAIAAPGFPCVLKPLALSASRGVIRADDAAGFVRAWRRLAAILSRPELAAGGDAWARHVLVEDYLPGSEHAVEGLLTDGRLHPLAIFDKPDPLEGPFFEETIYVTPSRLPEPRQTALLEAVQTAALALGLRQGPIHAELRLNAAGPWMLEIAPRAIGGLCGRSLRFVPTAGDAAPATISLEALSLRHALGEPAAAWRREPAASGVMMIPIPRAGILRGVRGLEAAQAWPGVDEVRMGLAPGTPVEPPPEGAQYLGFIFAHAETPAEVEAALRSAHQQLEFEIETRDHPGGQPA